MGKEILCPSGGIFWGHNLAFCTHHLKKHRVGQRPQAPMDEIATMLFILSQEHLMSELKMETCNGGEEEGPFKEVSHSLNHLQITDEPSSTILCTHWLSCWVLVTTCIFRLISAILRGWKLYFLVLAQKDILSYRVCCLWVPQTNNLKQTNGMARSSLTCLNGPWRWIHRIGVFRNALPHRK